MRADACKQCKEFVILAMNSHGKAIAVGLAKAAGGDLVLVRRGGRSPLAVRAPSQQNVERYQSHQCSLKAEDTPQLDMGFEMSAKKGIGNG